MAGAIINCTTLQMLMLKLSRGAAAHQHKFANPFRGCVCVCIFSPVGQQRPVYICRGPRVLKTIGGHLVHHSEAGGGAAGGGGSFIYF